MAELRDNINKRQGHPQDRRLNRDQAMRLSEGDFKFICQFVYDVISTINTYRQRAKAKLFC